MEANPVENANIKALSGEGMDVVGFERATSRV
jgi:hypothetical protein